MLMDHLGEIQRLKQIIMLYEKRNFDNKKFKIKNLNQELMKLPKSLKKSMTSQNLKQKPKVDKKKIIKRKIKKNRSFSKSGSNKLQTQSNNNEDNPDAIITGLMQENRSSQTIFALSEEEAINKLKDNDILIFLNKITTDESGFYQLIENLSKRGLFQLYDCISTIIVKIIILLKERLCKRLLYNFKT